MRVLLSALVASTAAAASMRSAPMPADSVFASKLLSKATRELENNDEDFTWVAGYSVKYTGCSSLVQVAGEEGGGGDGESKLYTQHLVKFSLCPTDYCYYGKDTECPNGARYVIDMRTFVEAYTEYQLNAEEMACENLRENYCDCENANDDEVCENQCYADNGMDYCIEYEGQEEFEIQRYLECAEMEENNNNNNNNNYNYNNGGYRQLFIGPYCNTDNDILLGAFYDEGCQNRAPDGTYEDANYGNSLPFSSESIVKPDCVSCLEVDEDNNNNNNNNNNGNDDQDEDRVIELCEQIYEESGKCESDLPEGLLYYPDDAACDFLDNVLPKLEAASSSVGVYNGSSDFSTAKFFAIVFGLSTVGLLGYVAYMHSQQSRKVDLSSKDAVEEQRREFS